MPDSDALNTIDLGFGITCVDTGYIRPGMTACYLLEQRRGAAFIETGVNRNVNGLLDLLHRRGIAREQVEYVMPTHVHLDHAGGVGALMRALPNAQLLVHPRGARHMVDPSALIAGASAVYGQQKFNLLYGELLPVDESRVSIADDGFVLDFRGRRLEFIDTPGHARHHYCIVDELSGGIFTGDTMGLSYPELNAGGLFALPTTTPVQFDPAALHASIDHIAGYQPERLYLTHFGCVEEVTPLARQLHRDIDAFVDIVNAMPPAKLDEDSIIQALGGYLHDRATRHDNRLSTSVINKALALDISLNAQGLKFWAERSLPQHRKPGNT